jgi:hypothetical protein
MNLTIQSKKTTSLINAGSASCAEQKPHSKDYTNLAKILNTPQKVETRRRNSTGFRVFMYGFLAALDLSAVPLYGDDRSITPSASTCACPRAGHLAQNKSHTQGTTRI